MNGKLNTMIGGRNYLISEAPFNKPSKKARFISVVTTSFLRLPAIKFTKVPSVKPSRNYLISEVHCNRDAVTKRLSS